MTVQNSFNKPANDARAGIIHTSSNMAVRGNRQVIMDTETTGLEGSRLVSIGLLEMVDGKMTGKSLYEIVNPEVEMEKIVIDIHHITNEIAATYPLFADGIAQKVKDFIGDSQIVITCRTVEGFTLDIGVLNYELKKAGLAQLPAEQWLNVRQWGEEMFGYAGARLDAMLDRYGISREQRDAEGHGALLDAKLLAQVYVKLKPEYEAFSKTKKYIQNLDI